jgi:hypothetical protein
MSGQIETVHPVVCWVNYHISIHKPVRIGEEVNK